MLALLGCAKDAQIDLPGFQYLNKQVPIDVADILVLNATDPGAEEGHPLLPGSIVQSLEDWAHKRFQTVGSRGKAVITIHDAHTFSANLIKPENVCVLLNSDKPAYFGTKAFVTIEIVDMKLTRGKTDVKLDRKVQVDSDVKLGFRARLWQQFHQTFMNALMISDVESEDLFTQGIEVGDPMSTLPTGHFESGVDDIKSYMRKIQDYPLLDAEEEFTLAKNGVRMRTQKQRADYDKPPALGGENCLWI